MQRYTAGQPGAASPVPAMRATISKQILQEYPPAPTLSGNCRSGSTQAVCASERALLAEHLLASLDQDNEIDAAWAAEVASRLAGIDGGSISGVLLQVTLAQTRGTSAGVLSCILLQLKNCRLRRYSRRHQGLTALLVTLPFLPSFCSSNLNASSHYWRSSRHWATAGWQ